MNLIIRVYFYKIRHLIKKRNIVALSLILLFYFIYINQHLRQGVRIPDISKVYTTFKYTLTVDKRAFMTSAMYTYLSSCVKYQNVIIVNGWENNVKNAKFICCFRFKNKNNLAIVSNQKLSSAWAHMPLRRIQYKCPVPDGNIWIDHVSIVNDFNATCPEDLYYFVKVSLPLMSKGSNIAICSLISYRSQDAALLVEWFEAQRLIGVNKIVTYTQDLNSEAIRVLDYYESMGLVHVIREFDMPKKDEFPRFIGEQNIRQWTDKEVVTLDCNSRLLQFKYVIMCDKDEFLVPNITKFGFSLRKALDHMFDDSTAGFQLNPKLHITTWTPYNRSSSLFISKYLNSTSSVPDRHKYVYMPERVVIGSTNIHEFTACEGYKIHTAPSTVLDFHHYRACEPSLIRFHSKLNRRNRTRNIKYHHNSVNQICADFRQSPQGEINDVVKQIEKNVLKVREKLGLSYQ